jgi:hypothetical protein
MLHAQCEIWSANPVGRSQFITFLGDRTDSLLDSVTIKQLCQDFMII